VCTHNLAEAEELADKIAIIRMGRIIALGTPSELKHQLLGPEEFQVTLTENINNHQLSLPDGLEIIDQGPDWLRFRTTSPMITNPKLLENLLSDGLSVLTLKEIERSLESVYLQAVNQTGKEVNDDVS
jgi:ABC-2 type transport system ATP-binding protein